MPDKPIISSPRIQELTKRLETDPRPMVYMDLAKAYQAAGEGAEAVRVCRQGLEKQPGYHSARVLLGKLLLESGDAGQAMEELRKVVTQAPDNLLAWRLLGTSQEGAGRRTEALETYRTLLRLQPGSPELLEKIEELESSAGENPDPPASPAGAAPAAAPEVPPPSASPAGPGAEAPPASSPAGTAPPPGDAGVETLDVRQDVEEESGEGPSGETGGEAWIRPTEAFESPDLEDAGEDEPPPTVQLDPSGGEPRPEEDLDEPGPAPAPAGGGAVPRTVALDASEISLAEDPEDRPTSVLEASDLPGGAAESGPGPGGSPEPAGDREGGRESTPPAETRGPGEEEARTVMIPSPAFHEPAPPPREEEPGPAPPDPGSGAGEEEKTAAPPPDHEAGPGPGEEPGEGDEALPTPTLAELYLEQGMPGKAVAVYEKLLAGDPDNTEIRRKLGELRGEPAPREHPARAKIRALQGWLEKIRRSQGAQSGP